MKDTLKPGLEGTFRYRVTGAKTVPRIYADCIKANCPHRPKGSG